MKKVERMEIVVDTNVLIDGSVIDYVKEKKVKKVIIPKAVLSELEHQANMNKEIGRIGLETALKLKEIVEVEIIGEKPGIDEIRYAKLLGSIDEITREVARERNATLLTNDFVSYMLAKVEGIKVESPKIEKPILPFIEFFKEDVMSVHIKENAKVKLKKGKPGKIKLVCLEKRYNREEVIRMIDEIAEASRRMNAFFEIDKKDHMVIQLKNYRIVITKPPLSAGYEITIVKPVKRMKIEEYNLPEKLLSRLEKAEGILISGKPGHGKSTFAAALANFYAEKGKIVKTIENPRDLQVSEDVVQYNAKGRIESIKDIILLARPDYTIFDEVRTKEDFELYIDLRLSGVGMVGVVHANQAIDAIQRFLTKAELGIIPQVINTVLYIEAGEIKQVLTLKMVVKVPTGMRQEDLSRPVIEVRDFYTNQLLYEIYKFGEETNVVPVQERIIEKQVKRYVKEFKVEGNTLIIPNKEWSRLKRKKREKLMRLTNLLGLDIVIE